MTELYRILKSRNLNKYDPIDNLRKVKDANGIIKEIISILTVENSISRDSVKDLEKRINNNIGMILTDATRRNDDPVLP